MPAVQIFPIRLTTICVKGCTRRWLTTRLADIAIDACPECGAPLVENSPDVVTTRPCCGQAWNEEHAGHCPRARRSE